MAKAKKESKYQKCEICGASVLIVFEGEDGKKRCARCAQKARELVSGGSDGHCGGS